MKHCPKCEREYNDLFTACPRDGMALLDGPPKPWEQVTHSPTPGSSTRQIRFVINRYLHYVVLALAFISLTTAAVSYSFVRNGVGDLFSRVSLSRPTAPTPQSQTEEVLSVINGWTAATNARDLQTHMSYYAETLPVYYNYTNISKDGVLSTRAPAFAKYSSLNVRLTNIQITVDASSDKASATFDKTWEFKGKRRSTGSTQQMLSLSKINGRWLITGERDTLVRYANW